MNITFNPTNTAVTEVYRTVAGCVFQSDDENCFYVDFDGRKLKYTIGAFFRLKNIVDRIDLEAMVMNISVGADVEIISPSACEHCYVLTLVDIIALKDLLQGAKVMLDLNSIIRERLFRIPA